jgi:hypothetical protein
MSHLVLGDSFIGSCIGQAVLEAKKKTSEYDTVEFNFNGIKCIVDKGTVPEFLERDFMNAHVMGWVQIGPKCEYRYDADTEIELYEKRLNAAKVRKKEEQEYEYKLNMEKAAFNEKVKNETMQLKDDTDWLIGKNKNTDPYGSCIYYYAEGWAKLMQIELAKGVNLIECAERTSHELGFIGITRFMYGAAVSILSHCWLHGEELRKWHNKEYNHDGDGVVNPAILTIKD